MRGTNDLERTQAGMDTYARILHELRLRPGTAADLVERRLCGACAARAVVAGMHAHGLVYISGWRAEHNRLYHPVYRAGTRPDATPPTRRPNGRPLANPPIAPKVKTPRELHGFLLLLEALRAPVTVQDVLAETGLSVRPVRRAIEVMHNLRLIRIADWKRRPEGGEFMPMFACGTRPDEPRPTKISGAEVLRRYRARRRERERLAVLSSVFTAAAALAA